MPIVVLLGHPRETVCVDRCQAHIVLELEALETGRAVGEREADIVDGLPRLRLIDKVCGVCLLDRLALAVRLHKSDLPHVTVRLCQARLDRQPVRTSVEDHFCHLTLWRSDEDVAEELDVAHVGQL